MKSPGVVFSVLLLAGFTACSKKREAEQKIIPPIATVADTIAAVPVDTTLQEAEPQVVASAEGEYTVQVSSWRTSRKAEKEAQRFRQHGYAAYVQQAYLPTRQETWHRVRVGRYGSAAAAAQVASDLRSLLESGFWIDRFRPDAGNE